MGGQAEHRPKCIRSLARGIDLPQSPHWHRERGVRRHSGPFSLNCDYIWVGSGGTWEVHGRYTGGTNLADVTGWGWSETEGVTVGVILKEC
jgi:hypothetical protein